MKIYNTLSHKIEEFKPINPPSVGMYSCGPTVYDYQHIGHMRRYVGDDILIRVLKENGYKVKHVMNITDVGHLTSDSDTGEDKMEKGAKKFGVSVWDVAKKFEKQFWDSIDLLNIKRPDAVMHATDFIKEQIDLIKILEEKSFTYKTTDGIYFDTSKFKNYSKLSGQKKEELKAGSRVEVGEKKGPTDFALWKFSHSNGRSFDPAQDGSALRRQMEWESPWGVGFPGWHIECSAMSMKALGQTLDIHTGGIDHISIHHTNEIAQSEAITGKQFVKYWVHHNFLQVEGEKMSKSLENIYTAGDIIAKGFDPMALRYLYLQTHYRQEMNFTWEALEGAQKALNHLREEVKKFPISNFQFPISNAKEGESWEEKFLEAINDDLNMPKALAVVWEMVKSNLPSDVKLRSLFKFDGVLGLNLREVQSSKFKVQSSQVSEEVQKLVKERESLRKQKKFKESDEIRDKIKKLGYEIEDKDSGEVEVKKTLF